MPRWHGGVTGVAWRRPSRAPSLRREAAIGGEGTGARASGRAPDSVVRCACGGWPRAESGESPRKRERLGLPDADVVGTASCQLSPGVRPTRPKSDKKNDSESSESLSLSLKRFCKKSENLSKFEPLPWIGKARHNFLTFFDAIIFFTLLKFVSVYFPEKCHYFQKSENQWPSLFVVLKKLP